MIRRKWTVREIALGVAFLAALMGILTFYVWYQTESVRLGMEIARRRGDILALKEEIQKLQIRKTFLLAPERVEKIAREELGLVDPKPEEIIYGRRAVSH
jgi:cell division protein FtsL